MDSDAKTIYDGRTGEPFDNRVSVGVIHDRFTTWLAYKLHARSVGLPMVTQQPLEESSVWWTTLGKWKVGPEAYGASNVLQEILTYKSDDVNGRLKAYEAIAKGKTTPKPGTESFRVLVKELQFWPDMFLDEDDQEVELRDLIEGKTMM